MKANKKKPRQRNRPRNKANRIKDTGVEESLDCTSKNVKDADTSKDTHQVVNNFNDATRNRVTTQPKGNIQSTVTQNNGKKKFNTKSNKKMNLDDIQLHSGNLYSKVIKKPPQQEQGSVKSAAKSLETDVFIQSLQKQMESMMLSEGRKEVPNSFISLRNLQISINDFI